MAQFIDVVKFQVVAAYFIAMKDTKVTVHQSRWKTLQRNKTGDNSWEQMVIEPIGVLTF